MKLIQTTILLMIAILLAGILIPVGVVYDLITAVRKPKKLYTRLVELTYAGSLMIDKLGNVLCAELFNDTLQENGYKFGNGKETISSVLGKNKEQDTLTKTGGFLERFLHLIDPFHVEESIDEIV